MKGLLIKDGRLMITQGKTLLGIAVFMIVCSFLQGDSFPQFAASYSIMMMTIFTISTVSYDEYDNGIKYLLVLPVERRTYVKEKYCFGILMSCIVWGICSLIGIAGAFFQNADGLEEYLISSLSVAMLAVLLLGICLPAIFYYGAEKGRGIYTGMLACIFFAAIAFFKLKWNVVLMENEWFRQMLLMMGRNRFLFITAGIFIYLGILTIAYQCAVKIMEHREF